METLQAQEVDLRDLILVISQSMSETRNLELQTQVLGLTNGLSRLTRWLTVLTIVLVVLGVATLVVQLVNTPAGTSNGAPSSHATSPAASQSPRPQPAASVGVVYEMTTSRTISILSRNCLCCQSSLTRFFLSHIGLGGLPAGGEDFQAHIPA